MAPARRRLVFFSAAVLAALAAALTVLLPATIASGAGHPAAGNRVWAISLAVHDHVRADGHVSADQRQDELASCPFCPSGACVAPEAADGGGARYIFRTGSQTDAALTDASGVSFRDSVSSAADGRQTFRPGDKVFAVDTEALPNGSVVYDNDPAGHVSVFASPEEIRSAIVSSFPDNPLEMLRQMEDGSWRLPRK